MFKKVNLKTLLIVFGALLGLVIISQLITMHKGERNFRGQLIEADTAKISAITIKTKAAREELKLVKTGKEWTVTVKGKTYKADHGIVEAMKTEIAKLKAERVAATEKSEWSTYEVADTSATRVKVEQGGREVADVFIGKFSFQQNPQKITTYIRLSGEDEVYAVDGFLAMTFNKRLNDLRNKTLIGVSLKNITRLTFTYPGDSSFVVTRDKNLWKLNGQVADSSKVNNYMNSLSYTNGNEFVDDAVKSGVQVFSLKIEGNNFNPVELNAFSADTTHQYIITSSINPDARFSGKSSDLTNRIFVGKKQFRKQ